MAALYPPNVSPTAQVTVGATTPVALGGNLQGQVTIQLNNQGMEDAYVYANGDGTLPAAATVRAQGTFLAAGGTANFQGTVQSLGVLGGVGGSFVSPQYWAATVSGTTIIAVGERLYLSEERA